MPIYLLMNDHKTNFSGYLVITELCAELATQAVKLYMLIFKVHEKFINEFVFINHFESSQIYEHCSQYGNTDLYKCLGCICCML